MKLFIFTLVLAIWLAAAARLCPTYKATIVRKTSHNREGLKSAVDSFSNILGGKNNGGSPGPLPKGQRSINWDANVVPFNMPFDFFRVRGTIFSTSGNRFAVSNPPDGTDDRFDSINPRVKNQFITFSPKRLFTPVLSNRMSMRFTIPGSDKRASVSGFGAVFVDVDRKHATFMTFKDRHGCKIATVAVPPRPQGLSFVGVKVHARHGIRAPVAKIDMKLGNSAISFKRHGDVVVLDDFLFGEPQAF